MSPRLIFAASLKAARLELEMSQETLAEMAGLHRTYIGQVERGERNISIDNMFRLSVAVNRSLTELLQGC
jgi:transcriptional regulator with XRE-family HTH domain